jgi:AGZA family xanthine/uracil permease-like MFS transporter
MSATPQFRYRWFVTGDIGASATIIFDNLTLLTFIAGILKFAYQFPTDIIMKNIIPGTAFGVMVSNLLCFILSFYLAKKQKRQVTAIPSGLDAPSAIGFIVCIIGPAFIMFKQHGADVHQAAINAWHVGMGCLFVNGLVKLFASLFIKQLKALIPSAALLGAIGGVAMGLIGFFSLSSVFAVPIVGLISLAIVFLVMLAHVKLPFGIPGIAFAIIAGTIAYYVLIPFGLSGTMPDLSVNLAFLLPLPTLSFVEVLPEVLNYIPVVVPFALLVIFGTMSVDESAVRMGENYGVRNLAVIDGIATTVSALFGGIAQTTPYAGFPAYKKMDAKAGFLLVNIIVLGIGGMFGLLGFIVNLVPEAAVAPVLLYVAFEIAMQGFVQCDKKYVAPILFAFFPNIARLVEVKIGSGNLIPVDKLQEKMFASVVPQISDSLVVTILGNGFIVTGILWASFLCFAIDRRFVASFVCCIILSILSYFGIIHSLLLSGAMVLPSQLPQTVRMIPLEISIGYLALGLLVLVASWLKQADSHAHHN